MNIFMNVTDMKQLETPAILVDLDMMDHHLTTMAKLAEKAGVKLRPHIKTHKSAWIAEKQLAYGASGITVATLGEAEVMAEAGVKDILIAFPMVGHEKLIRLSKLMQRAQVTVSIDDVSVAKGLSDLGEVMGGKVPLYVDVNTGLNRCGKEPGEETVALVQQLTVLSGVQVSGLMTHAGHAYSQKTIEDVREVAKHEAECLVNTKLMLAQKGIHVPNISVGSTPTAKFIQEQVGVTEVRPGAYVFGDRSQTAIGIVDTEQCALKVMATVVSMPRPGVAIIDAGSKTFSSDANPHLPGYGVWDQNEEVYIERLSEEHGIVSFPESVDLHVGQKLMFIPNHCCTVVNLHDRLAGGRGGLFEQWITVDARGKIN